MSDSRKQRITNIDTRVILKGQQLAEGVKNAIDAGELQRARANLNEAFEILGSAETPQGQELSLTLQLEHATIVQYTGNFDFADHLAAKAVKYADEYFGPRGIQAGRARLRRYFAMEAKREFGKALTKNLELESELRSVLGSDALRLNCLTRAIACAVKNADRGALSKIGSQSEPIREVFDPENREPIAHHSILRWHYFWCAVALLRQGQVLEADALLTHASGLGPRTWRWENATNFARAHGLTLIADTAELGKVLLRGARVDAEERGFHGLVRSIDAGFSSPGLEAA